MQLQYFPGDRKPETGVAGLARAADIRLVKPFEHVAQVFFGNSAPRIADLNRNVPIIECHLQSNDAIVRGMPDGVVEEVYQDALDESDVGIREGQIRIAVNHDLNLLLLCL